MLVKKYSHLLSLYPPVVTLDQLYRICHISKRKGRWLLENGVIPCRDTGKKTHRFLIRLSDIIVFLEKEDMGLTKGLIPKGIFTNKKPSRESKSLPSHVNERNFESFLRNEWAEHQDALTPADVVKLLGYHRTTVNDWTVQKKLTSTDYYRKTIIAKEHLIRFIAGIVNHDSEDKPPKFLKLIEKYQQRKID